MYILGSEQYHILYLYFVSRAQDKERAKSLDCTSFLNHVLDVAFTMEMDACAKS